MPSKNTNLLPKPNAKFIKKIKKWHKYNHVYSPQGWVYVISDGNYVKIGKTENSVEDRIKQLQTGNPNEIKLIFKIYCAKGLKAKLETEMHNLFTKKELHHRAEWFKLDILNYIDWAITAEFDKVNNPNDIQKFIKLIENEIC
jgi:hypothetical protein